MMLKQIYHSPVFFIGRFLFFSNGIIIASITYRPILTRTGHCEPSRRDGAAISSVPSVIIRFDRMIQKCRTIATDGIPAGLDCPKLDN
jgi:hypothetical protein